MRPRLIDWLLNHGLPVWLAPDYATMVGMAAVLGAIFTLRLARRDGEDTHVQARALLLAYVAALLGGYVFEWIRALPLAIELRSPDPVVYAGRAAYGGLLAALAAPALYLRRKGRSVLGFFDRAVIPLGLAFAFVRVGCFLEGCDFGQPTSLPWGVRFPPGSLAARAQASLGWIPPWSASLPVHPTELYEAMLGLVALGFALPVLLRRRERDGRAFAVWMAVYAVGRFSIELLRGDVDRGVYAGLSSSQYVSLAVLAALGWAAARRVRARAQVAVGAAVAAVLVLSAARADAKPKTGHGAPAPSSSSAASAAASAPDSLTLTDGTKLPGKIVDLAPGDHATIQTADGQVKSFPWASVARVEESGVVMSFDTPAASPAPAAPVPAAPAPAPTSTPAPSPASAPTSPATSAPEHDETSSRPPLQHDRFLTVRLALVPSITVARPDVPSGTAVELDALYRLRLAPTLRFEVGLEGRRLANVQATEWSGGIPLQLVLEVGRRLEVEAEMVLMQTWFLWAPAASSYFANTNAYGMRLQAGAQYAVGAHVLLGASPIAFTTVSSETVGVITAWEPRAWVGVDF